VFAIAFGREYLAGPGIRATLAGVLVLYTAATFWLLRAPTLPPVRVVGVAVADLLFIAAIVEASGGIESPFFGLYHLIAVAAAILYGIGGGLLATAVVFAVTALGQQAGLHGTDAPVTKLLFAQLSELPLTAMVAGSMAAQLKRESERRHATEREALVLHVRGESAAREMALAREVQQAALPAAPPRTAGLQIAARFRAAADVGGDFYDFYERDGRIGLIVGDAAGKGVAAALVATTALHLFHTQAPRVGLATWLAEFNRELDARAPDAMLATAVAFEVHPVSGHALWVSAGHPPPLLCRNGAPPLLLEEYGLALGVSAHADYHEKELILGPGDLLVLYTDGLTEAVRRDGSFVGFDFLPELLPGIAAGSAEEVVTGIEAALLQVAAPTDDLTLVVVKKVIEKDSRTP
jgi:serine phosphatase RsbU (regulator of sigma subunit)